MIYKIFIHTANLQDFGLVKKILDSKDIRKYINKEAELESVSFNHIFITHVILL